MPTSAQKGGRQVDGYGETEGSLPQLWPGPAGDSVRADSQQALRQGLGCQNCRTAFQEKPEMLQDREGEESVETDSDGNGEASPHQDLPGAVSSAFESYQLSKSLSSYDVWSLVSSASQRRRVRHREAK